MFKDIPQPVLDRMQELEEIDSRDRQDGTPHLKRLRQIPPETGKALAWLALSAPAKGAWLEIGTSAGYSSLWLSLAARHKNAVLHTFELLPDKAALARETFKAAGVGGLVELKHGDARGHVGDYGEVAFCFIDCEKEMYQEVFERIRPNLVPGALLIADNVISHADEMQNLIESIESDAGLATITLPVGKGLLLSRRLPD